METTYDLEPIKLTDGYIEALENLMREQLAMMRQHEPDLADCWTWGVCRIGDLAYQHLDFEFGGDEDKPRWLMADVAVEVVSVP